MKAGSLAKRQDIEHQHQAALFAWAETVLNRYPLLALMYAVPNGGDRHIAVAAKLKAEGVKKGFPDVGLPVARGIYHGLFVEMKKPNAKPSDTSEEQRWWHDQLQKQNYMCVVCKGWDEARETIVRYINL